MQQFNKITEYLEAVSQQIRWKRAQAPIIDELKDHIVDQKEAFIHDGLDEELATQKAIAEMGDPVMVGEQLDRAHRPRPDWALLGLTAVMLLLGSVIQYFIGSSTIYGDKLFEKHLVWAGIAILVMFVTYFVDFTIIGKHSKLIFGVLCILTLVYYPFAPTVNGRAIYMIYPLLLFPTAFAGLVYAMRNKGYHGVILCGLAFIIPAFLAMLVPSITVLFLLTVTGLIIITAAILKGWFNVRKRDGLLMVYIPTVIMAIMSIFSLMLGSGYRLQRILVAFNPSSDPQGGGYIGTMVQRLLSHSNFIGEGLPLRGYQGYAVTRLLPEANTDFLLTHSIYSFGWLAGIGIIAIMSFFIVRALILCSKQRSVLGFLVSLAIILTFSVQFIVYIAANMGFLLLSPLSLPLISYGGRALIVNMFLIGFLLSVFRTGNLVRDKVEILEQKSDPFIQFNKGRIIINLLK